MHIAVSHSQVEQPASFMSKFEGKSGDMRSLQLGSPASTRTTGGSTKANESRRDRKRPRSLYFVEEASAICSSSAPAFHVALRHCSPCDRGEKIFICDWCYVASRIYSHLFQFYGLPSMLDACTMATGIGMSNDRPTTSAGGDVHACTRSLHTLRCCLSLKR